MSDLSAFSIPRGFSLILLCALLGACSTTQKSSTGAGQQAAAPISEAGQAQTESKPGEISSPAVSGSASPASPQTSISGRPAGAATGSAATGQDAPQISTTDGESDEAAQLKRLLAEEAAQIVRLRDEQEAAIRQEEAQAALRGDELLAAEAARAGSQAYQPGSSAAAPVSATNGADDLAVFPADPNNPDASADSELAVQPLLERSVYFGYNEASVPDRYDAMLMAHAAYMKANPNARAQVQGNCDERGSREYNLALGARRAEAVKRALDLAGADGSRISAISYGAEKPVATGNDEESYSKNRRADIVY